MSRPDLRAPWKLFVKLSIVLLALIILKQMLLSAPVAPNLIRAELVGLSPSIKMPVRQIERTRILLYSVSNDAEDRLLKRSFGDDFHYVPYQLTWAEHFGYCLVVGFSLGTFWFAFSYVGEDWTQERARYVSRGKLSAFAALHFSYGVASFLGWVWMSWRPFFFMGACIFLFCGLLETIPRSGEQPWRLGEKKETQLEVPISSGRGSRVLKVNPLIRKMFEKQSAERSPSDKISIGDALASLHADKDWKPGFEVAFETWLNQVKQVEGWKYQVALERHSLGDIRRVAHSVFVKDWFRGGSWVLLDTLATRTGTAEQLISYLTAYLDREGLE